MPDEIDPADLLIEIWSRRPPGGQQVSVDCGVKITHLPSGLIAISSNERSQHRNRSIAMDMILSGLTSPYFRGG